MGTLTRDELINEVSKNLGGRVDNTRIVRHLNMAQDRIARQRVWPELNIVDEITHTYTGVAATDKFHDLTQGGTIRIKVLRALVRIISGESPVPLVYVPDGQWSSLVGKPDALANAGDPTHYNRWKPGYVEFWPVPSRKFALLRRYRKEPDNFSTAGSNVVSNLVDKDDIIIAYSTSSLFNSLGMRDDGGRYFNIGDALLRDAKVDSMTNEDEVITDRGVSVSGTGPTNYIVDPFTKAAP